MTHFSVLVTGSDYEAALAPFHEFECTGIDDQYVQTIDETETLRAEFAGDTEVRMKETATGLLFDRFDDKGNWLERFSQPDGDSGFLGLPGRRKELVPPGFERVEIASSSVKRFARWIEDYAGRATITNRAGGVVLTAKAKFGYTLVDAAGEVIATYRRTNPNRQWDWYQVGGRFANKLLLRSGLRGDRAAAGDIDWDGMVSARSADAAKQWDEVRGVIAERPFQTWAELIARMKAGEFDIAHARGIYAAQPVINDLHESKVIDRWDSAEEIGMIAKTPRSSYVERKGLENSATWALLHAGKWTERGHMGWFGMSDDTPSTRDEQTSLFWDTVRSLSPETICTVVDCHI